MLTRSFPRFLPNLSRGGVNTNTLLRPRPHPLSAIVTAHPESPCPNNQCRMWSNTKTNNPRPTTTKRNEGASSGRIAWIDNATKNSKKGIPKLCSGCGVEMVSNKSSSHQQLTNNNDTTTTTKQQQMMASGEEATQSSTRSKRQEKRARYADVLEKGSDNTLLCQRCVALKGGNVWKAYDALKDVDAKVFSSQLAHIVARRQFGLCIVVVDATDPEFSSVRKLRDSIRATPCILAINKADLLPRGLNQYDLKYLQSRVEAGRTKMIGAYGVSAQNGTGMIDLAEFVLEKLSGRDVFVVGSANVGKSTLVKNLSSLLARTLRLRGKSKRDDDKRKNVLQNLNITRSHLPGTTLQAVRIPCFPSVRHALWDTPGIINKAALAYSLFPSHLMEPLAFPTKIDVPTEKGGRRVRVERGYSILIEAGWVVEERSNGEGEQRQDDEGELSNIKEGQQKHGADELSNIKDEQQPFTLARLDIIEDNGMPVEALAFIPSCLTIRVVPTESAPELATIPKEYIAKIQQLVGNAGNFDDSNVSRPLTIFKGDGKQVTKEGVVPFSQIEDGGSNGWIRRDIVFASLGWIMVNHRRSFSVKPWCVKESLWSKRNSLYPSNLEELEWDGDDNTTVNYAAMDDDDPEFEQIKGRLQRAFDSGRHEADKRGKQKSGASDQYSWGEHEVDDDDDDVWY